MALKKTVEQPTGVAATYWRVMETLIDWSRKTLLVRVGGYLDEETRREDRAPLTTWQKPYRDAEFPLTLEGKNVAEIYAALKQDPFFTGAEDA